MLGFPTRAVVGAGYCCVLEGCVPCLHIGKNTATRKGALRGHACNPLWAVDARAVGVFTHITKRV